MKLFLIYFVLGFFSSTPGKSSCPGRYKSVSYQLGSKRKESCYFVSTEYIRWEDAGYFCARNHNGYLAEFASLPEWEAFKTFISNIANRTKDKLWDGQHAWIGGSRVWKWNTSGEILDPLLSNGFPKDDLYGLTINVHSKKMVPQKLTSLVCPGHPTIHSYVCESDERVERETENQGSEKLAGNNSESRQEVQQLQEEAVALTSSLERTEGLLREREQIILSLERELEASRKTTTLPSTTEATTSLEQPPKPQEQATDFLISNVTFAIKESDYEGDAENGEAKSNVVEAGGLSWRMSMRGSIFPRILVHAEGGRGAPSPWTLTAQSLTVKVLRKGGEGGTPYTLRLEGATFSSEKGVLGMLSGWSWIGLTNPSNRFLDPQGTLHLEVSFEEAAMSPSPPPQRPTLWEAEATLQLRNVTSSLRDLGELIFSPSIHVGGKEWRVWVGRGFSDGYSFRLLCNPEERSTWSLKVDFTITLLSAEGGGGNLEKKMEGEEVRGGSPWTSWLFIPDSSIGRFLTGDNLSVAVKIRVHH
ncbi:unnamed protein product [Cyprideis torosa]|uniref:MATH domain-containing protein n=1 Tax=Cyprideis torosa TaxID=163714 RepID=A0A7R8WR61_9CRUS|nr:unnamed protein product [Cyprideis torosa]CAG0903290.1 unnamed protein product [Cyprideis torosa]